MSLAPSRPHSVKRHSRSQGAAAWAAAEAKHDGWKAVTPRPTAIMCAEAVWWRCHRSLIADYLKARGVEVLHILGANKVEPHPYTSAARIVNGELSYAEDDLLR